MVYTDLTPEQQALYQQSDVLLAQVVLDAARLVNRIDTLLVLIDTQPAVATIVESLDAGTVLPRATDLPGAGPLNREAVLGIYANLRALRDSYRTDATRRLHLTVCGPAALMGR